MMIETLFDKIEPAEAMQIRVKTYAAGQLCVAAPLPGNQNDKQTAFAGSLASGLLLAGWGVLMLRLQEAQLAGQVMIVEHRIRYERPVRGDFMATAAVVPERWEALVEKLEQKGRGSVRLKVPLISAGELCAEMEACYVVVLNHSQKASCA